MTTRITPPLRLASAVLATALAHVAQADTITLSGNLSGQASTATAVTSFNSQTNTFTFTVTNTSAITQPGSTSTITGIGFDLPPAGNASASGLNGFAGSQAPSLSSTFTFSDGVLGEVPGFGSAVLDFGFLTGPLFNDGDIAFGLSPGESASFTVSGAGFTGFTEGQISNGLALFYESVPQIKEDVAAGLSPTAVPEPATALLIGVALAGWGAGGARRRRAVR